MQQHPRRWALEQPDRIAISYPSLDVNISYRTLDERANKAAHFMRAQGLERGDNIALLVENTPVFHEIC